MSTPTEVLEASLPSAGVSRSALGTPSQGAVSERPVLAPPPQRVVWRELVKLRSHISGANENCWKRIFPGESATQSDTAFLRRAAPRDYLRAMVYMTDVCTDIGLFGCVLGRHTVAPKGVGDPISETDDSDGPAAPDLASRRNSSALPERLRRNRAVKADRMTDTEPACALLDALWSITGHARSIAVFNTKGTRHGGKAGQVECHVMTCVIG